MKKRIVALLLVLCVTAGLLGGLAFAQEGTADGAYGFVGVSLDWNTGEILNRETYFQQELHRWPGISYPLQFVCQEGDTITPITPTRVELTMTNGASHAIRLENLNTTDACPVYQVHFLGLGEGYLTVTLGENESFQIPVSSALPELGFYSRECSTEAELEAAYLPSANWDGSQEAITVYALFKDQPQSVQLDSFAPDEGIVATCTPLASNRGFLINITGFDRDGDGAIWISATATFANGQRQTKSEWIFVNKWVDPGPGPGLGSADAEFYATAAKSGEPLTSLPIGNALKDRTFYVFPKDGEFFPADAVLTTQDVDVVTVEKLTDGAGAVYFKLVFNHDAIRLGDGGYHAVFEISNFGRISIPVAKPVQNHRYAEIEVDGQKYLVGLLMEHDGGTYDLNAGLENQIEIGRPGPPNEIVHTLGAVTRSQNSDNLEVFTPAEDITKLLKLESAQLYTYKDGVSTPQDDTNPDMGLPTLAGLTMTTLCKDTASDCGYYMVVTFTVGDDTETKYSFYTRYYLHVKRTLRVNLTESVTLSKLNDLLSTPVTENYTDTEINLVPHNGGVPLNGQLVIGADTPMRLNASGAILNGTVRINSAPNDGGHEIRDLYCISTIDGIDNETDVGVNGEGNVFLHNCSFTGYHTGVHMYEINPAYTNYYPRNARQKAVQGCWFLNCGTGISVNQSGVTGLSNNTINRCLFSCNNAAVIVKNLDAPDNEARQLNFESCAFLGNGSDVINNSDFTLKMYRCYFGLELDGGGLQLAESKVDGMGKGVITAPQVRSITKYSDSLFFSLDETKLLAMGSQADVDNDDNSAFDVSNLTGGIKVWQQDGYDYRQIASWYLDKLKPQPQPHQSRIMASVVQAEPETVDFNPQVNIQTDHGFTMVQVQSSEALTAYSATLTIDCVQPQVQVMHNGLIVPSTLDTEAKMLTFQVSEGGLYTVQPYQELYSMPAFGDGTVTVPINLAALGPNAPASDSVQVLCAFYTAAGQMVDCQTADMIQDCENLTFQTEADYDKIQVSILDKTTWQPLVGKAPFQRPPENG